MTRMQKSFVVVPSCCVLATLLVTYSWSALSPIHCLQLYCRYLYDQINSAVRGDKDSIFTLQYNDKIGGPELSTSDPRHHLHPVLDNDIRYHMYISHAPCGDASMAYLCQSQDDDTRERRTAYKRQEYNVSDINVTNLVRGRDLFDVVGILRTKPGRGDSIPSLSYSCSDKLAKWNYLGLQGSLLFQLLRQPIYLTSIVIGDYFDQLSMKRALCDRIICLHDDHNTMHGISLFRPNTTLHMYNVPTMNHEICTKDLIFIHGKSRLLQQYKDENLVSADIAILWHLKLKTPEYLVQGLREGAAVNKKGRVPIKVRSAACKSGFFSLYCDTAKKLGISLLPEITYYQCKQQCVEYTDAKARLYSTEHFKSWRGNDKNLEKFVDEIK